MTTTIKKLGRPSRGPIAIVRIWLCGTKQTEPLKAISEDGGEHWEIVSLDPLWRGCVLNRCELQFVSDESRATRHAARGQGGE